MNVGFIGGGKMAEAIIADLINSQTINSNQIFVCDINEDRLKILSDNHGVNTGTDSNEMLSEVNIVFLAVKPQSLSDVLKAIEPSVTNNHLVISIAAGKNISFIESHLPRARVIRVMPNMAALVSQGMNVFCAGSSTTTEDHKTATTLLSCSGKVLELPEEQFDAVTAVSGSGPAFFTYFISQIINAGEKLGLERKHAKTLACQTMLGTATLLTKGGLNPSDLIQTISSAKGTTVAGMEVIKKSDLKQIAFNTLTAAAERSKELSN